MKQYTWQLVVRDAEVAERTFYGPHEVADWARTIGEFRQPREHFWVVLLDTRNKLIGHDCVSIGSTNSAVVHPREVFRTAVAEPGCVAVIVVHNHPSGDPTPSKDDVELTRRLVEAGKILGIEVLDHLIITPMGHIKSMREGGHIS